MFPNLEEQQKMMQEKLSAQEVQGRSANDAIIVMANAIREIKSITIDRTKVNVNESEELEDHLILALNETILQAQAVQAKLSQELISEMLPPGLGSLKNLFGG